jgi:Uma2 family endonuclease
MVKVRIPRQQRLILDNVSWERYTRFLRDFSDNHCRLTYDRGVLEIMTLSHEHEGLSEFLGLLVVTLTQELELTLKLGGSTTFRQRRKKKGIEPDRCYWIANEAAVRGKTRIDLRVDPPPDVALEVDITHSSMDRLHIYAALRVPEVWRYDAQGLAFLVLNAERRYVPAANSPAFPIPVSPADLMPFLQMRGQMDENAIVRQFRDWIRSQIRAGEQGRKRPVR